HGCGVVHATGSSERPAVRRRIWGAGACGRSRDGRERWARPGRFAASGGRACPDRQRGSESMNTTVVESWIEGPLHQFLDDAGVELALLAHPTRAESAQ